MNKLRWQDLDAIKLAAGMGEGNVILLRSQFEMLMNGYEDSQQEIYELKRDLEELKRDDFRGHSLPD